MYKKEWFDHMEVKPKNAGWYWVTLYQFNKLEPEHPDYIKEHLHFDGKQWDYVGTYAGNTYVCFIHASSHRPALSVASIERIGGQ